MGLICEFIALMASACFCVYMCMGGGLFGGWDEGPGVGFRFTGLGLCCCGGVCFGEFGGWMIWIVLGGDRSAGGMFGAGEVDVRCLFRLSVMSGLVCLVAMVFSRGGDCVIICKLSKSC